MTTLVPFAPSTVQSPPFQQTVTLDGQAYVLSAAWNLYRGDWYITITDQSGSRVITQPLIGSPMGAAIYLAPGIFTASTILYRVDTGNFETSP